MFSNPFLINSPHNDLLGHIYPNHATKELFFELPDTDSKTEIKFLLVEQDKEVTTKLKNKEGLSDIYLAYKGESGATASMDWFNLTSTGAIQKPEEPEPLVLEYEV